MLLPRVLQYGSGPNRLTLVTEFDRGQSDIHGREG